MATAETTNDHDDRDDESEPCGESMCRCDCATQHGPCGCDCPREIDECGSWVLSDYGH